MALLSAAWCGVMFKRDTIWLYIFIVLFVAVWAMILVTLAAMVFHVFPGALPSPHGLSWLVSRTILR